MEDKIELVKNGAKRSERVAIFIDGSNFYHSLKSSLGVPGK